MYLCWPYWILALKYFKMNKKKVWKESENKQQTRSGCKNTATSQMQFFETIIQGFKPFTDVIKSSIFDMAGLPASSFDRISVNINQSDIKIFHVWISTSKRL